MQGQSSMLWAIRHRIDEEVDAMTAKHVTDQPAPGGGPVQGEEGGPVQGEDLVARTRLRPPDPRALFDPAYNNPALAAASVPGSAAARANGIGLSALAPAALRRVVREVAGVWASFYQTRLSYLALLVTSVMLCYVGGGAMFWFHAVELGEGGPAISWYAHWMLDSTFGFIALTPALAVIIPFAAWIAAEVGGVRPRLLPWLYAVVAGAIFAVITIPGPFAHDLIVGRGTWLANEATALVGDPSQPLTPKTDYPMLAALTQQLGAAVPIYLLLSLASVLLIRRLVGARQAVSARARIPVRATR